MTPIRTFTTIALVDDPDISEIKIVYTIREGQEHPFDSMFLERALLKHVGTNLFSWFKYCRDVGLKETTEVPPVGL